MIDENKQWKLIGSSVIGANHIRLNMPNQDVIKWKTIDEKENIHVMSVADGHGSQVCFRSHIGAKLASEIMNRLILNGYDLANCKKEDYSFEENITSEFVRLWTMYVKKHLRETPFIDREVSELDSVKRRILGKNAYIAYGSTLITVLVWDKRVFCWQLGDGDVLLVNSSGKVLEPISKDERFIGNETTSTCSPNAVKEFRTENFELDPEESHMFLIASDGYSNSFRTQSGFRQAGIDFFKMIQEDGIEEVDSHLSVWLEETSKLGSGDDISVGIMYFEK